MNTSFVNFWNNGRGICIAEMPELEELCQELKSRNVRRKFEYVQKGKSLLGTSLFARDVI